MSALPVRMWINQPSTLDSLHRWHGTNVLAIPETDTVSRAYLLSGDVSSMQVPTSALSRGWTSVAQVRPCDGERTCPLCCGHGVVGQKVAGVRPAQVVRWVILDENGKLFGPFDESLFARDWFERRTSLTAGRYVVLPMEAP